MTTRRGRPATPAFYIERIRTLAAADQGPGDIHRALEREAKEAGQTSWPSLRVVQRERLRFLSLPRFRVAEYDPVAWPETMEGGLLPWEAGPSVMELLTAYQSEGRGRPSVRDARWYWRVRGLWGNAPASEADLAACRVIARRLAALEVSAGDTRQEEAAPRTYGERRALELAVAFTPWRSQANTDAYRQACSQEGVPPFSTLEWQTQSA